MTTPPQRTVPARWHGPAFQRRPEFVVWHATAGGTADSSLGWLNRASADTDGKGRASYHVLIDRDGTVIYHTPLECIAYHAGRSAWPWPHGASLNSRSRGVAFANRQAPKGHPAWEPITEAQIASACWLMRSWEWAMPSVAQARTHLRHRDIAPNRRQDIRPDTLDWNAFVDRITTAASGRVAA